MKFTPEQVIEMAREAGFDTRRESVLVDGLDISRTITRLCTLAADRALEAAAAGACEQADEDGEGPDSWGWHSKDYAKAIRAMKERQ